MPIRQNPDYTLSFIYYPVSDMPEKRLQEHKDTVMITILWAPDEGVEANIDGKWYPVTPKPGYVVVNFGNALELMTGKQYCAIEHRVIMAKENERLSVATFLGPAFELPFVDFTTGKIISDSYGEYAKQHISNTYSKGYKP